MVRFSIYKVYMPMHDGFVVMGWRAVQFPGSLQVVQAYIGGMLLFAVMLAASSVLRCSMSYGWQCCLVLCSVSYVWLCQLLLCSVGWVWQCRLLLCYVSYDW